MKHTGHSYALNAKWADEASRARCAKGLTRNYGEYAPVLELWTRQTPRAAVFPTHGMIAHSLLRWQRLDGSIVDWKNGRLGDVLTAPVWALTKWTDRKTKPCKLATLTPRPRPKGRQA